MKMKTIVILGVVAMLAIAVTSGGKSNSDSNAEDKSTSSAVVETKNDSSEKVSEESATSSNSSSPDTEQANSDKKEGSAAESAAEESSDDYIDPEFKAFWDSYEDFVDEYVDYLKHYDSSNIEQLEHLSQLVDKEAEFAKKAAVYEDDEEELTDAEVVYMIDVSARIEKKLLEASMLEN